jgi:hypothetical protein
MFDILIPIHMPAEAGFAGESDRGNRVFNGEIGFKFGPWAASFHEMQDRRYIIVRLGLDREEASGKLPHLLARIARASALLDVSMRPVDGDLVVLASGQRADLKNISLFPTGEMPYVGFGDGSFFVKLPIGMLSDALDETVPDGKETAFKLFADVDFEATTASRFVTLSTIMELLAERGTRDAEAIKLVDRWIAEAGSASRPDLAQALVSTMRTESIGSAIARVVRDAGLGAGCDEEHVVVLEKRARDANRKRGALLHRGTSISVEELSALRAVVRLLLVGAAEGTPFTPIGNRVWARIDE